MPKDIGRGKAIRKFLARTKVLGRKEREPDTDIPYVDENKVVRAGKLSLRLTLKPPSSTQRGRHDRRHASTTPSDIPFAHLEPMPPSNPKDKGKARASAEDLSDNENASASRSGPAVHPYASIPQASTSPSRQLNVPASSSRRSSSPSPLYSPPLATRRASSASSSRSRPYTARVATDTEDEQYEYNSSASWSEARFFDQGTRQDASGSRQSVSPLESFREPSPPGDQTLYQSFAVDPLLGALLDAKRQPLNRPPAPAKPPKSYHKAKLAQVKDSKKRMAAPPPALQAAAKSQLKSVLKKATYRKPLDGITEEAGASEKATARPKTPRNVHWNDKRANVYAEYSRSQPIRAASPPLRMPSPPLRLPSPPSRPPAPPPRPTPSSSRSAPHLPEVKKTVLEKRHIKYEWTDEEGPCSVIRPSPKMTNCDRHAQDKRAQRLWSIVTQRKCGRIPSRRRLLDIDGHRRQKIIHDPDVKKRLQREKMVQTLRRGGSRETTPKTRSGRLKMPESAPSSLNSSAPSRSSVSSAPQPPLADAASNKAEQTPAPPPPPPPPPPDAPTCPSSKATSTTPQTLSSEPVPDRSPASKYAVEPPRTPARKPATESFQTPARKAITPPTAPPAPAKPSPSIISPEPFKPSSKLSLQELVAELAKVPAPPKPVVPPVIQVLHVEVEMDPNPPPQYMPQAAPPAFQAPWPGPQPTYYQAAPVIQDDFMDIDAYFPYASQWQGPPPPSYQQQAWPSAAPQYTEFAEAPMDVDEVPIISPVAEIPPEPMFVDAADYTATLEEHYTRNRSAILYVEERANWSFEQVYSTLASALRLEEDLAHSGVLSLGDEAVLVFATISGNLRAVAEIGHHDLTNPDVLRAIHRGIVVAFRERMSYGRPDADPRVLAVQANLKGWAQGMLRLNGYPFPPEAPPASEPPAQAADEPRVPEAASGSGTHAQSEAEPPVQCQEAGDRKSKGKECTAPDASSPVQPEAQSSQKQGMSSNSAGQMTAAPSPTTPRNILGEKYAPPKSFYTPDNLNWDGIMNFERREILAY